MTYYEAYLNLYENLNKIYFCDDEIYNLFGIKNEDVSSELHCDLIYLLDKLVENGFNEGFEFAMKIFFNSL